MKNLKLFGLLFFLVASLHPSEGAPAKSTTENVSAPAVIIHAVDEPGYPKFLAHLDVGGTVTNVYADTQEDLLKMAIEVQKYYVKKDTENSKK